MKYYIEKKEIKKNKFILKGWTIYDKASIDVSFGRSNNVVLKPNVKREDITLYCGNTNKLGFECELKIPFMCNKIVITIKNNDEVINTIIIDNLIFYKIGHFFKKIGSIIKKVFSVLIKNPKILFSKNELKKYKEAMKNKIAGINTTEILDYNNQNEYIEWIVNHEKYTYQHIDDTKYDILIIKNNIRDIDKLISNIKELTSNEITIVDKLDVSKLEEEYSIIINNDMLLSNDFFDELNNCIKKNKDVDFIYFDGDYIDDNNCRINPMFKPDYSYDNLLLSNYIGNLIVINNKLLKKININSFYDISLNIFNKTKNIKHISKVLYHEYRIVNVKNDIDYQMNNNPLVSIIIPTRDHADDLDKCISSIINKSTYTNYEITIIDNGSVEEATFNLFNKYSTVDNINIIKLDCEFNYSYLNNEAVKRANGDYIILLNNDTEIISPNWIEMMLSFASKSHVGAVGVKLLYSDNSIQHGGVIIGLGGIASHAFIGKPRNFKGAYHRLDEPNDVSAVTAACLMVSKEKYNEVNGLDEELKVAYNDVDFCLKFIEKGYFNVFIPNVELYHFESKSRGLDTTDEKRKRFQHECDIMNSRWKKYIDCDPFYNSNFSKKIDYKLDRYAKVSDKNEQ